MRPTFLCLALALIAGCGARNAPVKLQGEPVALAWLAGDWTGQYWGTTTGRSGTVEFYLSPGRDTVYGDVTMLTPIGGPFVAADAIERHRMHVRSTQSLHIDFVAVAAGTVSGTLEPYVSPDCSCTVTTTFTGTLAGNVISGVFVTRGPSGQLAEGRWRVVRRATTRP